MKRAASVIQCLEQDDIAAFLSNGSLTVSLDGEPYTFVSEDITVTSEGIEGWSVGQEGLLTVALDMRLTPDLRNEGLSREIVNRIQNMRKAADFQVTDRIVVNYMASEGIQSAIERYTSYIQQETLAVSLRSQEDPQGSLVQRFEFEEGDVSLAITVSS
jgi:isoleucyl-tRNA synthetase